MGTRSLFVGNKPQYLCENMLKITFMGFAEQIPLPLCFSFTEILHNGT